ncbi:MAG TPA: hypothetical protein VMU51_27895 [Mycobacteriales bacterium]|nr:hypothetical protein [Mycobacteriales bacterium]
MVTGAGGPIGAIRTTTADAGGIRFGAGQAGLVLGTDQQGGPVSIQLFRPRPTRVFAVGGLPFVQLLCFRALAIGARIGIRSDHPARWSLLLRQGLEVERTRGPRTGGLPARLDLTIVDGAVAGPAPAPAAGVWSTVLTVRPAFTAADADTLARADLALLQPLPAAQAALVAAALQLPAEYADYFRGGQPDLVVAVSGTAIHCARLLPTLVEHQLLGDPSDR